MITARALVGLAVAAVLAVLCLLHVYWAAGGRWAQGVVVPEVGGRKTIDPGPGATLVVAALLGLACATVALRSGVVELDAVPGWLVRVGAWVLTVVFALRAVGDFRTVGFFKRVRATPFARWDTRLYSPLCLLLAVGCLLVALP